MNHEPTMLVRLTTTAHQNAEPESGEVHPRQYPGDQRHHARIDHQQEQAEVSMVMGSVSRMAIGRTTELTTPSSTPARISVVGAVDVHARYPRRRQPQAESGDASREQKAEHGASIA